MVKYLCWGRLHIGCENIWEGGTKKFSKNYHADPGQRGGGGGIIKIIISLISEDSDGYPKFPGKGQLTPNPTTGGPS